MLAVVIALKSPAATVHAVDISESALVVARANALRHGMGERVRFHAGDGFKVLDPGLSFDLIVSNPPYISSTEIATLEPEVREFDPRLALDGGTDGLEFYRLLAAQGRAHLKPAGRLMLEFGEGQHGEISALFTNAGWTVETVAKDYTGRERILIARPGEW